MINPLVPQVRADKNGKLVTRHVKGAAAGPSQRNIPSPSLVQQYVVPSRDITKQRRSATTKTDIAEAKKIYDIFGVPESEVPQGSVKMSDNEILDYMEKGFTASAAVEFKRIDVTPEIASLAPMKRLPIQKTVQRMRALDLTPEEATRIIKHGMVDSLLDQQLSDNELFGLLHDERLNSSKYAERSAGVRALIVGTVTREDYRELELETLGKYGGYLAQIRKDQGVVDHEVFKRIVARAEAPYVKLPTHRYHEGWTGSDYGMDVRGLNTAVKKYGPEILDLKYLGVLRMGMRFGETLADYQYMDKFFTLAEDTPFLLKPEQKREMQSEGRRGFSVADFTNMLREEGLSPEQAVHALTNNLTIEKAREIHLNKQATSLIEGWL